MTNDLPNVLNLPFKITYRSGKSQYVTERFASIMLGKEYDLMASLGMGAVYVDTDGDRWEQVHLEEEMPAGRQLPPRPVGTKTFRCKFPGAGFDSITLREVAQSSYLFYSEGLRTLEALDVGDETTDDYGLTWVRTE